MQTIGLTDDGALENIAAALVRSTARTQVWWSTYDEATVARFRVERPLRRRSLSEEVADRDSVTQFGTLA